MSVGWPPPVDESTEWVEIVVEHEYGHPPGRAKVRWVRLWGRAVQVNAAGAVWCWACRQFKSVTELGHPWNSCPVGIQSSGRVLTTNDPPNVQVGNAVADFETDAFPFDA